MGFFSFATLSPPPSSPPGTHPSLVESGEFKVVYSLVRTIRAEAQGLDEALRNIKEQASEKVAAIRDAQVQIAVKVAADRLLRNTLQVDEAFDRLKANLVSNANAADMYSDEVTHMQNAWEEISAGRRWPQQGEPTDQIVVMTDDARALLQIIIYHSGLVSIPPRLNQHLDLLRVGQTLSFGVMFQDELSEKDDQVKLLQYLHQHPAAINGVIDVQNGLVYRASPNTARHVLSYVMILGTALLGGALAYWLPTIEQSLGVPGLPTEVSGLKLLFGYITVLLGGLIHIGIDALKQVKQASTSSAPTLLAVGGWLTWLHIRELYIVFGIISYWIGFLGLVFYLKDVQFLTAFLVGYSVDSFVDLFLQRFTADVGQATTELSNRVKAQP